MSIIEMRAANDEESETEENSAHEPSNEHVITIINQNENVQSEHTEHRRSRTPCVRNEHAAKTCLS